MSELMEIIEELAKKGNLSEDNITTRDYILGIVGREILNIRKSLGDKSDNALRLYNNEISTKGDLSDISIIGYGDAKSFKGAGPSRLMHDAAYGLKLIAYNDGQIWSNDYSSVLKLQPFIEDMKELERKFTDGKYDFQPSIVDNHAVLAKGRMMRYEPELGFDGLMMKNYSTFNNVSTKGTRYFVGGPALILTMDLGRGVDHLPTVVSKNPDSIRTIDALTGSDPLQAEYIGGEFHDYVLKSKNEMNDILKGFNTQFRNKMWLLAVYNQDNKNTL
ncbi:MAG: hypothetical protein ACP5OA_06965 [Candidatus Woesearchaeota archaeon]